MTAPSNPTAASHAPLRGSQPESGRGATSGQPFPVADLPGRPYLRPHRMANAANDQGMKDALRDDDAELAKAAEELAGEVAWWVIAIGAATMFAGVLAWLIDSHLDRVLP